MTKINILSQAKQKMDVIRFFREESRVPTHLSEDFKGKKFYYLTLREGKKRELWIGIGKGKPTSVTLKKALGLGVKKFLSMGASEVVVHAEGLEGFTQSLVEGALIASYVFEEFKMKASRRKNCLKKLDIVVEIKAMKEAKEGVVKGQIIGEAVNRVRALGNLPGSVMTPVALSKHAQKLAKELRLSCKVWNETALKKEGFGGIVAVGKGSENPPRLIRIDYRGGGKKEKPWVIVGKAVTFDSGGISLKPGAKMDEMKFDKMGGCTVLGIMEAVAKLRLKCNVTALIASAENMPGGRAYRPGDILKAYDGRTIEVLNTDAEGRVILADALAYARRRLNPEGVIDLATLTGACLVALGMERAGVFSMDEKLRQQIYQIGEQCGDRVWPLPVGEEYDEMVKSDVAMVKNTGGGYAGASTAASFLKNWVDDLVWAHLDIAGTAWSMKEEAYREKGATGFGVRLVTEFLKQRE